MLDGASVLYGSAASLEATIDDDLRQERAFRYDSLSIDEAIDHIATFIANLWQIHPFVEGNTRTTALFLIHYVRSLGLPVDPTPFFDHSWYFRNSLVRANYSNIPAGVHPTPRHLVSFLRNVILGENTSLHNRELHIGHNRETR